MRPRYLARPQESAPEETGPPDTLADFDTSVHEIELEVLSDENDVQERLVFTPQQGETPATFRNRVLAGWREYRDSIGAQSGDARTDVTEEITS